MVSHPFLKNAQWGVNAWTLWFTSSDAGSPSLFHFSNSKRSRKDIITSLPSYTKLASPFLGAVQQCSALLLCPKHTLRAAHTAASSLQSQPGQQPLLAPLNSLQNISRNRFHCVIINTGHNNTWKYNTTVLQICLSHSSTPFRNTQISSLKFTEVHVPPPRPSHPLYFLHAQIQSCPARRMIIMTALKHECFPIFISLNQRWITGNTKPPCHRHLFCFG